jgi:hypothetical protein
MIENCSPALSKMPAALIHRRCADEIRIGVCSILPRLGMYLKTGTF